MKEIEQLNNTLKRIANNGKREALNLCNETIATIRLAAKDEGFQFELINGSLSNDGISIDRVGERSKIDFISVLFPGDKIIILNSEFTVPNGADKKVDIEDLDDIQKRIYKLKVNEELILGRDDFRKSKFPNLYSRSHLTIRRVGDEIDSGVAKAKYFIRDGKGALDKAEVELYGRGLEFKDVLPIEHGISLKFPNGLVAPFREEVEPDCVIFPPQEFFTDLSEYKGEVIRKVFLS